MTVLLTGALQLGLLYSMMAMGLYISFRILGIPDLTVEGSFTLGMAVSVMITSQGHPVLALIAAVIAGSIAGLITGLLQTKVNIPPILSGIITMTALYSVNLSVMGGKANLSLFGLDTVFSIFEETTGLSSGNTKIIVLLIFAAGLAAVLSVFFKTRLGISIRATGDNEDMVRSSSINADFTKCVGFMTGNACVSLSGALLCQYQKSGDINFGVGMVVIGLASIIIGEAIFGKRSVTVGLISVVFGATAYQMIIALALQVDLFPAYWLKFISAAIVAFALAVPAVKAAIEKSVKGRRG